MRPRGLADRITTQYTFWASSRIPVCVDCEALCGVALLAWFTGISIPAFFGYTCGLVFCQMVGQAAVSRCLYGGGRVNIGLTLQPWQEGRRVPAWHNLVGFAAGPLAGLIYLSYLIRWLPFPAPLFACLTFWGIPGLFSDLAKCVELGNRLARAVKWRRNRRRVLV